MEFKCEVCNKNFETKDSLNQHNSMKHVFHKRESEKGKINFKKYFIIISIIIILLLLALSINTQIKKPGKYDGFAKCLKEKGAIIYGNDYCSYTNKQLGFFGKSQKYLNYVKCIDNEALCDEKNIKTTPTWEINGGMYSGVQTFEALSAYSRCEI